MSVVVYVVLLGMGTITPGVMLSSNNIPSLFERPILLNNGATERCVVDIGGMRHVHGMCRRQSILEGSALH